MASVFGDVESEGGVRDSPGAWAWLQVWGEEFCPGHVVPLLGRGRCSLGPWGHSSRTQEVGWRHVFRGRDTLLVLKR